MNLKQRKTIKASDGSYYYKAHRKNGEFKVKRNSAITKLGMLEDLIDEGKLVFLPLIPDDDVWVVGEIDGVPYSKGHVTSIIVVSEDMGFYVGYPEEPVADGHVVRDIGKTVFFTEEEAMEAVQKR